MPLSGGESCVGSDPSVQISVRAEMGLLPRHFAITQLEGVWYLGAYEGAAVWVNGQPVSVTELRDGDRIVAGQLELTYREEPEMAVALSMPALALMTTVPATLQMGTSALLGDGGAAPVPPMSEEAPERAPMRMPARTKSQPPTVTGDSAGGWSIGRTVLIGVLMVVPGGFLGYGAWFDWPEPLKQGDLVFQEAHILEATRHQPRKGMSWMELQLDPSMNRIIELPEDLPFNPVWSRSMAKIGFVKKLYDDTHLNKQGQRVALKVITLEAGGKTYRSLNRHNVAEEGDHQIWLLAAPFMLLVGVALLMTAWKNWKVKREPIRLDRADAMQLAGNAIEAVVRSM